LPQAVLDIPRLGCLNIHGSLLPRWRGAAPIHRALLAGDSETGITIMRMEAGLDTGPMLLKDSISITPTSTASSLHDALAEMGAKLIVQTLDLAAQGRLTEIKQPEEGVTYAAKLTAEDGVIDWTRPAADIERQVRGLNPWPGAFFKLGEETIKVLKAEPAPQNIACPPATLLDEDFTVVCGDGTLRLTLVQRAGKKPIDGASFLRGARLAKGERLA
jgi:methionyl-tRNA formyltransferase